MAPGTAPFGFMRLDHELQLRIVDALAFEDRCVDLAALLSILPALCSHTPCLKRDTRRDGGAVGDRKLSHTPRPPA